MGCASSKEDVDIEMGADQQSAQAEPTDEELGDQLENLATKMQALARSKSSRRQTKAARAAKPAAKSGVSSDEMAAIRAALSKVKDEPHVPKKAFKMGDKSTHDQNVSRVAGGHLAEGEAEAVKQKIEEAKNAPAEPPLPAPMREKTPHPNREKSVRRMISRGVSRKISKMPSSFNLLGKSGDGIQRQRSFFRREKSKKGAKTALQRGTEKAKAKVQKDQGTYVPQPAKAPEPPPAPAPVAGKTALERGTAAAQAKVAKDAAKAPVVKKERSSDSTPSKGKGVSFGLSA